MSKQEYRIVHKDLLPTFMDQVLYARQLIESHQVDSITKAVQMAGISRATYYKYKDSIYTLQTSIQQIASYTMIIKDESGALSAVLHVIAQHHGSILTISQTIPIQKQATIIFSLDVSSLTSSIDELNHEFQSLPQVLHVKMDAIQ